MLTPQCPAFTQFSGRRVSERRRTAAQILLNVITNSHEYNQLQWLSPQLMNHV